MYNPFSLEGKKILVIGASSGIGKEIAIECSRMGAIVIVSSRNENALKNTLSEMNGDGHSLIVTDVTIDEDINNMVSMVPVLDGVVLDSGVGFTLPITFCSKEKFRQVFEVNFFGHSEIVRLLYKKKKIVNDGSIVFISSIGSELHAPANSIYDAAKSAMNSFMESCALEFSSRKVRVNAVLPGMTHTKLTAPTGALTEEDLKKDEEKYPLRRYAEPLDIARPVVFLLSDAASWITGTRLKVDGGISLT